MALMERLSIVRENILTRPGYTPYCGAFHCRFDMPRTSFDGEQFKCSCGWRSAYEPEFIEKYKAKREDRQLAI